MEITLHIKAPELVEAMNNLATVFTGQVPNTLIGSVVAEGGVKPSKKATSKAKEKEEIKTAPVDKLEVVEETDYTALRNTIRKTVVKICKSGRKDDLRSILTNYGVDAASAVADENLEEFYEEMKALVKE